MILYAVCLVRVGKKQMIKQEKLQSPKSQKIINVVFCVNIYISNDIILN